MTRQERRKRRRQRRRMQAALLASLLFALVLIVTLRIRETAPEPVAERTSALAAERQTLTYIAPARPEAAEETPEELTVEPEPENRYAELHFSDEDVYILACLVYHEARGESFEGQVAVVEVVLNRMSELLGKVVVVTQMKKIPTACAYCKYYENMGGNRGRGSDGVCTARGTLYATRGIRVSKERLDNCPLRIITGGRE